MNLFTDINYLAVLVATIVYFMIGFVWYSLLFNDLWTKETGMSMKSSGKPKAGPMIGLFVSTFLYSLGIAVLLKLYGTYGIAAGIFIGLMVTLFFVIPINSGNLLVKDKKNLFFLDVGERALGSIVVGIILGLWG